MTPNEVFCLVIGIHIGNLLGNVLAATLVRWSRKQ